MKIFISGPMTGIENYNKEQFDKMEHMLTAIGHSVFNPAWLNFDETWERSNIMPIDIAALQQCDGIVMLSGWSASVGACLEFEYAKATEKCVYFEEEVKKLYSDHMKFCNKTV